MKYSLMLLILMACSSKGPMQLSDEAKEIEVLSQRPTNCHVMGNVIGRHDEGSKELALNDALNQAVKLGATALYIKQEVPNGRKMAIFGTAYQCE